MVVVVWEVDVDVEADFVLCVRLVDAGDVIIFECHFMVCCFCRGKEEGMMEVFPCGGVVEVNRICRKVVAVVGRRQ